MTSYKYYYEQEHKRKYTSMKLFGWSDLTYYILRNKFEYLSIRYAMHRPCIRGLNLR